MVSRASFGHFVLLLLSRSGAQQSQWVELGDETEPTPPRWGQAGAVITAELPAGGIVQIFGGCAAPPSTSSATDLLNCEAPLGDMWQRPTNRTWHVLSNVIGAPGNRSLAATAVDVSLDDHWYMFGGVSSHSALGGLWQFAGSRWLHLDDADKGAPTPRLGASMEYVVGELLLFGGCTIAGNASSASSSMYAYDVSGAHGHSGTWKLVAISGGGASPTPKARCLHSAASYVGQGGEPYMYVFGGIGEDGLALTDGLWRLDVIARRWENLQPRGADPGPRIGAASTILQSYGHPVASFVIVGGWPSPVGNATAVEYDALVNEWQYRAEQWPEPRALSGPAFRTSEPPDNLLVSGGISTRSGREGMRSLQVMGDTWQYSIGDSPDKYDAIVV